MMAIKEIQQELNEALAKLGRMLVCGEVSSRDPSAHTVKVILRGHDNVVTDSLPVLTRRAMGTANCNLPAIGEQVWCLFVPLAGLERGVVLGSTFNQQDKPPSDNEHLYFWKFKDGTTFYYDEEKSECKLSMLSGSLEITTPNTIINSDVQINGMLNTTGNIHSNAHVSDSVRTMAEDRTIYNDHVHPTGSPNTGKTPQQK